MRDSRGRWSRSTLLCGLLASTGVAGAPDSFFMRDADPVWAERWGLPSREGGTGPAYARAYLAAALKAGRGGTGVFGLRLMRENLEDLTGLIDRACPGLPSDRARLEAAFGRLLFVRLRREDRLSQAVFLVQAQQTGLWHVAPDGTELERIGAPGAPEYDPEYDAGRIAAEVARAERHDAAWDSWFEEQGIELLRIAYEGLAAEPAATLAALGDALGVTAPDPGRVRPGVAKLADRTSAAWMRRYRTERG